MKIYLSSTYEDLKDHRRVVFDALRQSGYQVIAMEDYVACDQRPVDRCLDDAGQADVYVGLFAFRYGYVPPIQHNNPNGLSITELEYCTADANGHTHCLVYVLDEKAPWPQNLCDTWTGDNAAGEHIKRLRDELRTEKLAPTFTSPHDLASKVQSAISNIEKTFKPEQPIDYKEETQITWDTAKNGPPYPGLMHFTRNYAPVFFGRETEVREVLDRMHTPEGRFLIISGDSGTGKSSMVDAGVLPKLEQIGLSGSESCTCIRMVPSHGDDAFEALVLSLHEVIENAGLNPRVVGHAMREDPHTFASQLQDIVAADFVRNPLVLFLDQMEELFVSGSDGEHLTELFLTGLYNATRQDMLYVVATIRNDLLHYCYGHPDMLTVLKGRGNYPLGRIAPYALLDPIVRPAQSAGVRVPEPLSRQLTQDVGSEPGNLPLLAFALRRLFERRQDDSMSLAVYERWGGEALGGLKGAIAEHADAVERELCESGELNICAETLELRLAAIFPSLVRVDLEGLPTRRHALITAFSTEHTPLVQALVSARLLITEGEGQNSTVSVAHERLFEAWPTLERWVASHQDELRTLRQAELETAEWRRHGYDLNHIWPSQRLKPLQSIVNELPSERVGSSLHEFANPQQRLLELLNDPTFTHTQRQRVGDYLVELGDPRPGVGLRNNSVPDIEWVHITGGRVVFDNNTDEYTVPNFEIACYPITQIQFQAFIDEDGYNNQRWWQDLIMQDPKSSSWNVASAPRDNVTWHEAVAFCRWLSDKLGYTVRLPTEFEWQQAATGGDQQRDYPWGPKWDAGCCNSHESRLNRTTIVGLYPHGIWTNGPLDMVGNVEEWCLNKYHSPKNDQIDQSDHSRTLRGGSWVEASFHCRAASRNLCRPDSRDDGIGFRVLCPLSNEH